MKKCIFVLMLLASPIYADERSPEAAVDFISTECNSGHVNRDLKYIITFSKIEQCNIVIRQNEIIGYEDDPTQPKYAEAYYEIRKANLADFSGAYQTEEFGGRFVDLNCESPGCVSLFKTANTNRSGFSVRVDTMGIACSSSRTSSIAENAVSYLIEQCRASTDDVCNPFDDECKASE